MEVNELIKNGKITAFNGLGIDNILIKNKDFGVNILDKYEKELVRDYILRKGKSSDKRIRDGLKIVNIEEDVLEKTMDVLSKSEILKLELAILLIKNVDYIVLYMFDSYFMEKDKLFFKKLLKKLVKRFGKTIILIDSKLDFMIDLVDRIVVKGMNNELEVFEEIDFYNEKLLDFFEMPKIIEFVKYVNKDKKVLNNYVDIKELIKAIYREV